ncbi:MAG TPA: hypothetical protein VF768_09845 [Holophagaceae bacterium]
MPRRAFFVSALALGVVASARGQEDPVLRARAQRAASLGVPDGDLPPLPKGIVEPPPLPPPETHVKDTPRGRRAHARKHVRKKGRRPVRKAAHRVSRKASHHRAAK